MNAKISNVAKSYDCQIPFLDIGWIFTDCKGRLYFQKHLSVNRGGGEGSSSKGGLPSRGSASIGTCLLGVCLPEGGLPPRQGLAIGRDLPNPRYWHPMATTAAVGTHPNGSSLIFYQKALLSSNFTKLPLTYALCRCKSNIRQDRQKCTIFSLTRLDWWEVVWDTPLKWDTNFFTVLGSFYFLKSIKWKCYLQLLGTSRLLQ